MKKNLYLAVPILAGTLWGMTGFFARYLYAAGMAPANVSAIRVAGSAIVLLIWNALTNREAFRIRARDIPLLFCMGIVSKFVSTFCYAKSQQMCTLAVSSVLLYSAPAFVVLLSRLLWKEPITKKKLLALCLTLLGCALVTGLLSGEQSATPLGVLVGLTAGLTYGLFTVFGHYALEKHPARTVTLWAFLFGSVGSLATLDLPNMTQALSRPHMALCALGIALLSTLLPNYIYMLSLTRVEPSRASILVSIEPAVSALIGTLVFREPATLAVWTGLVCILTAVYLIRR